MTGSAPSGAPYRALPGTSAVECFIAFVVLVMLFTALVVVVAVAQTRADRNNQAFYQLAQRFSGACRPAGWFRSGSVRFRYGATQATLFSHSGGKHGQATFFQLEWPDHRLNMEVVSCERGTTTAARDSSLVPVDDDAFDTRYAVRAWDAREAKTWLSEGVRWQIEKLRHFCEPQDMQIVVMQGRLTVKKSGRLRRFDELAEFCQLGLELYDQAMLTRSVGIEFVAEGEAQPIREAMCQVCGENIVSELVFCRRCKTPHHLDCWQYYGACSTYGCRETVFVTPRLAGPVVEASVRPNRPR